MLHVWDAQRQGAGGAAYLRESRPHGLLNVMGKGTSYTRRPAYTRYRILQVVVLTTSPVVLQWSTIVALNNHSSLPSTSATP